MLGEATEQELTLRLAFDSVDGVVFAGWNVNTVHYAGGLPRPGGAPIRVPRIDPCTARGTLVLHDRIPSGGKLDPLTARDKVELKCPQPSSG